jgi:hypothetical protein
MKVFKDFSHLTEDEKNIKKLTHKQSIMLHEKGYLEEWYAYKK